MVNGDTIEAKLARSPLVPSLLQQKKGPEEIIDELYVRTLSRRPAPGQKEKLMALAAANPTDRKTYEDILWALLNSTEFSFNH
jgi:hypothetical protein